LGMEKFSFSQLQQILLTKQLVVPAGGDTEAPIRVTYLMDVATGGVVLGQPHEDVLQFDCDITVPSLTGARIRQVLRRAKQREQAHVAVRLQTSKGRTTGTIGIPHSLTPESISQHLELAATVQEGPVKDECKINARIAYLMGMLRERVPHAIRARREAQELREMLMVSPDASDDKSPGEEETPKDGDGVSSEMAGNMEVDPTNETEGVNSHDKMEVDSPPQEKKGREDNKSANDKDMEAK